MQPPIVRVVAVALTLAASAQVPQDPAATKPTTRTVGARVVDERGAPLPGACLALGPMDELTAAMALAKPLAKSGDDGRLGCAVELPPPGDRVPPLALLLTAPGKIALGGSGYVASLRPTASPAKPLDLGDVVLFDAVTLRGRLRDPAGKPIAGGRVVATDAMPVIGGQARELTLRSVAVSDEKGLFTLPGVFDRALELTFAKDGFYQRRIRPVGRETPLVVDLQPSGFVSGRVLDSAGKGLATTLTLRYECGATASFLTEPDGAFRTTVLQPGRYRVQLAYAKGRTPWVGPILEGAQAGLELRPAEQPAVGVAVRALDATTGKPIASFSATAVWYATQQSVGELLAIHGSQLTACDADGRVTLTPHGAQRSGTVLVFAKGHAPEAVPVQIDDADAPKELSVKLERESWVAGKVVDQDGKGVAGVRVWAVGFRENSYSTYSAIPPNSVTSEADGTFRIGSVGAGRYCVQAFDESLRIPQPERVEIEQGKPREGVVIKVKRASTLRIELPTNLAEAGWKVRLEDTNRNQGLFMGGAGGVNGGMLFTRNQVQVTGTTSADGATLFENLGGDSYRIMLWKPAHKRVQRVLEVPTGTVTVPRDKPFAIDPAAAATARVTGSVDCAAAGIGTDRIVVLAVPHLDQMTSDAYSMRTVYGAATLDASGAFAFDVAPGKYDLSVLDVGTGQVLHELEEPVDAKRGTGAAAKIALAAGRVRIHLLPEREGAPLRVAALTIAPAQQQQQRPASYLRSMVWAQRGEGVTFDAGQTEAELWLAPGEYTVKATSRAGALSATPVNWTTELASDTLSVSEKGTLEVKLQVGPGPATQDLLK